MDGDFWLAWVFAGERFVEGWVHFDGFPFTSEVVGAAVDELDLECAEYFHRDVLDGLFGFCGAVVVGAVCGVGFEHGELWGVGGVDAFVAEVAVYFEYFVESAYYCAFEEEFWCDAEVEVDVEGVGVGDEWSCCCAAVEGLEHWGFDFEVSAAFEGVAEGAHHFDAGHGVGARLFAHDEVDVALAYAGVFGEVFVCDWEWSEGFCGHEPAVGHDGEFAAFGGDDASFDEDHVAEVYVVFPVGEGFFADFGEGEHGLEGGAVAVLEGREAEFAGVADEHDATCDADDVLGFFPWFKNCCTGWVCWGGGVGVGVLWVRVLWVGWFVYCPEFAYLGEGVGSWNFDWVGVAAFG